jgi:hypothetical protein
MLFFFWWSRKKKKKEKGGFEEIFFCNNYENLPSWPLFFHRPEPVYMYFMVFLLWGAKKKK